MLDVGTSIKRGSKISLFRVSKGCFLDQTPGDAQPSCVTSTNGFLFFAQKTLSSVSKTKKN